ncbi:glycosyltransferase family 39 protein [Denitrobaculum tricleocarpae]|uniref:Glycosyltransferase family 39 protein n=1 Tax=Denitrobaculum tricleocarpae TaxID=2591009 RepID=A0A545STB9_9PROT|nr:glycosyltransferase family 39 protein [Denitrobaculum tricleocarpae]TQV68201.1 hypothetical protein FKG95_28985 [Denitrobaculum tricleocarpae]
MQILTNLKNRVASFCQMIETTRSVRFTLLVLLAAYAFFGALASLDKMDVSGDENTYIPLSYNLYKYGVVSLTGEVSGLESIEMDDGVILTLSQRRGPAYLALLAASLHLHPNSQNVSLACFQGKEVGCESFRQDLKIVNVVILTLIVLITYAITKGISGNALVGLTAAFLVASSKSLIDSSDKFGPEVLASFLVLIASLMMLFIWMGPNIKNCSATGIVFGVLALCQPIYLYSIFVPFVVLAVSLVRHKMIRSRLAFASVLAVLLSFSVVTTPWIARNLEYFDNSQITSGGEIVLRVRAEHNKMNSREYFASFLYWTAAGRERLAGFIFDAEDYRRLNRDNYEDGNYRVARKRSSEIANEFQISRFEASKLVAAEAKQMILADPVKHILVSVPVAWRGLFSENGIVLHFLSLDSAGFLIRLATNFTYWGGMFLCLVLTVLKRQYTCLVFASLAIWAWAAYAGMSHFIPRYSYPLLPVLITLSLSIISAQLAGKLLLESSLRNSALIKFAMRCGLVR